MYFLCFLIGVSVTMFVEAFGVVLFSLFKAAGNKEEEGDCRDEPKN